MKIEELTGEKLKEEWIFGKREGVCPKFESPSTYKLMLYRLVDNLACKGTK